MRSPNNRVSLMKDIVIFIFAFLIAIMVACTTRQPIVIGAIENTGPSNDETNTILIRNESPFWVRFYFLHHTVTIGPKNEFVGRVNPSQFWRQVGSFSIIGHAYRYSDGQKLSNFVGEEEFGFFLSGHPVQYNNHNFGAIVWISGFPISPYGFPTKFTNNVGNIIPVTTGPRLAE